MIDRIGAALSRPRIAVLAIVALSIVLLGPALVDPKAMTGDSFIAYRWQGHFADAFWGGDLYPRWLPDLNYGLGSPVFFIYPPLSQWLAAVFDPIWSGPAESGHRMVFVLLLARIAGGVGTLRWLKAMGVSDKGALIGAGAFLLLPYHAFCNTYQRAACAELVGMAIIPWGLWLGHLLKDRHALSMPGFAVVVAALLFTHAPTALFGVPFMALYAVVIAGGGIRIWAVTTMASLLGAGLAATYLGPALTQISLINQDHLFASRYVATNYLFFATAPWPDKGIEIALMAIFAIHLALFVFLARAIRGREQGDMRARLFLLLTMPALFLLMSEPTRPLWNAHFPWAKIQFAWRMMSLQTVALAGLAGLAWDVIDRQAEAVRWRRALAWLLPLLFLCDLGMSGGRWWRLAHKPPWQHPDMLAYDREVNEYWLVDIQFARQFGPARVKPLSGKAAVTTPVWRTRAVTLDVVASGPARLAVRQWVYSGWIMRIDGGAWRPTEQMPAPYNLVVASVPAGHHRVEFVMPALPAERIGIAISWASTGLLLALLIAGRFRHARALVRGGGGSI